MNQMNKEMIKEIFSYVKIFSVAIIIAFIVNKCVIVNAETPTGSMENTIQVGDRYIGLRLAYVFEEPQRQDIIIFPFPDNEKKTYIKRVIGIPGDVVEIRNDQVYVNGELLDEPYLKEPMNLKQNMTFVVPEDSYFVMGDNRNTSIDARYWTNTYVKSDKIIAKALFKYYDGGITFEMME